MLVFYDCKTETVQLLVGCIVLGWAVSELESGHDYDHLLVIFIYIHGWQNWQIGGGGDHRVTHESVVFGEWRRWWRISIMVHTQLL